MVDADVILGCGSSVKRGLDSLLTAVPAADFTRWFGFPIHLFSGYPAPLTVTMPGVELWTPKLPYATWNSRTLATGDTSGGNAFTYTGGDVAAQHPLDSWLWIETAASGQGLLKRIATHAASAGTIVGTWGTALTAPGTIIFFKNSHTILVSQTFAPGDVNTGTETITFGSNHNFSADDQVQFTNSGGGLPAPLATGTTYYVIVSSPTAIQVAATAGGAAINLTSQGTGTHTIVRSFGARVTRTANTSAWSVDALIGLEVVFFGVGSRQVVSNTANTLTLDDSVTAVADAGLIVLDGTGPVATTLDGIAGGASLLPLQLRLNNAPCGLTGTDYSNFDLQPHVAPSLAFATINSDLEMYAQFRARFGGKVYGLDLQRDSCTISPYPIGTGFRPLMFAWQKWLRDFGLSPSADDGLYEALERGILSMKALIEAQGLVFKPRAFVVLCAENDQIASIGGAIRHKTIGRNLERLRDAVRTLVDDERLPFIAIGPSSNLTSPGGVVYAFRDEVYEQIRDLVFRDTYSEYVDTTDTDRYEYTADNLHLTAPSEINLGVDTALAWDRIVDGSELDDVGICNLALSHIGESAKVTALDGSDTSAQARHCIRFYEPALRTLLEMHSWGFATRRIDAVAVTNTREDEWKFAYEAPRDKAFAFAVLAPGSANDAPTLPFVEEADGAGRAIIYTDVENAVLRWNRYVTNTRKFSASFARALSWLIASDLAGPILKGEEGRKAKADCLATMRTFFGVAATHDSNQRQVEPEIEAPWMPGGELYQFDRRGFPLSGA